MDTLSTKKPKIKKTPDKGRNPQFVKGDHLFLHKLWFSNVIFFLFVAISGQVNIYLTP